jgi:hypothetical protein
VTLCSARISRPALGAWRSSPSTKIRKIPVSSMPMMTIMKPYVGMENSVPDSRRPRRFSAVSTITAVIATPTLCSATQGTTEPKLATPELTDTATVNT